jgi:putative spermidine/putrescine transport system permease protein
LSPFAPFTPLLPVVFIIVLLFGGGLVLAGAQSIGLMPLVGAPRLSLEAYGQVLMAREFWLGLGATAWVSLAATALAIVGGTALALLVRPAFAGKRWLMFVLQFNLPIPHAVGAIAMLLLLSQSGWLARWAFAAGAITQPADFPALVFDPAGWAIILEYAWKSACFVAVSLLASLQAIGADYENVARSLGAGAWQRFWYVTLPLLAPTLVSLALLVFAFTFGAFEVPLLLGQRFPSLLPVQAYRAYIDTDLATRPEAMALSLLITLLVGIVALLYTWRRPSGRAHG